MGYNYTRQILNQMALLQKSIQQACLLPSQEPHSPGRKVIHLLLHYRPFKLPLLQEAHARIPPPHLSLHKLVLLSLTHLQVTSFRMPHPSWHNLVPISLPHLQIAPCTLPPTTIPTMDTSPATTSIQGNDLAKFLAKGCGCKKACGRPCYTLFSKEHCQEIR